MCVCVCVWGGGGLTWVRSTKERWIPHVFTEPRALNWNLAVRGSAIWYDCSILHSLMVLISTIKPFIHSRFLGNLLSN